MDAAVELATALGDPWLAAVMRTRRALVNLRGVSEAVSINLVLAVVDFLSQLMLVIVGVWLHRVGPSIADAARQAPGDPAQALQRPADERGERAHQPHRGARGRRRP